jgi:hypothetical protein
MIVHIALNVLHTSYENFVQLVIGQDQLPTFECLTSKLLLEEQRKEAKFGKQKDNETLLLHINKHYNNLTKNNQSRGRHDNTNGEH